MNVRQLRLSPAKYVKGMYIEKHDLELMLGVKATSPRYLLRVLELRGAFEQQLGILCRMDGERLRLMTDDEAVRWNLANGQGAVLALRRASRRTKLIDHNNLTKDQSQEADVVARALESTVRAVNNELRQNARILSIVRGP